MSNKKTGNIPGAWISVNKAFEDQWEKISVDNLKHILNRVCRRKKPILYFQLHKVTKDRNGNSKKWFSLYVCLDNEIIKLHYSPFMKQQRCQPRMQFFVHYEGAYSLMLDIDNALGTNYTDKLILYSIL